MDVARYRALHELLERLQNLAEPEREALLAGVEPSLAVEARALLATLANEGQDAVSDAAISAQRARLDELAAQGAAGAVPPREVGPYRIGELLGVGGMGLVYAAEQSQPRRTVALKLLHPTSLTADRQARFRREAELLGRLSHPGIAQIYEASTCDLGQGQQPYFAMELVRGVNVVAHAARGRLGTRARMELVAQIADAVDHAHRHGVIHRDLKPDNVLVGDDGRPKVLDFGVARPIDALDSLALTMTREGEVVGTLAYMAPEQCAGMTDQVGVRSDVYALGVILYELLTGRTPLRTEGMSITRAMHHLANVDPPRPSTLDPRLAGDVETITLKALERDPARRYASAADLAADLRRSLSDLPIRARPPSRAYRARKFVRRHKGLVGTLVALLIGVIGTATFALLMQRRAAETRAANLRLEHALYTAEARMVSLGATSPGALEQLRRYVARWRAQPLPVGTRGFEFALMEALAAPADVEAALPARAMACAVAPDGARIALATMGAPEVRDAETLERIVRCGDGESSYVFDIEWSPDGTRLVTCDAAHGLAVWDAATGALLWHDDTTDADVNGVEWHPSGAALVSITFHGALRVHDATSGALRARFEGVAQGDGQVLTMDGRGDVAVGAPFGGITRYPWPPSQETAQRIACPGSGVFYSLALRADGGALACSRTDGVVHVIDLGVDDGAPGRLRSRRVHDQRVTSLAWSRDGARLASASWDYSATLLDAATLRPLRMLRPAAARQEFVAFARDGAALFTGGYAPLLSRWSLDRPGPLELGWDALEPGEFEVARVTLDPTGYFALTSHDEASEVWPLPTPPRPGLDRLGEAPAARQFALAPDGTSILAGLNETLRIESLERRELRRWTWSGARIGGVAFDRERPGRVYAYSGGEVRAFDADGGAPEVVVESSDLIRAMQALPGERLALGHVAAALELQDLRARRPLARCERAVNVTSIACSADGARLAVGLGSQVTLVLGAADLAFQLELYGHTAAVTGVAWSPDGARVATSSDDGRVLLWDAADGDLVALLDHGAPVGGVAFTLDGARLVATTRDGGVAVWSAGR